jgi:hypothetical protein
MFYESGLSINVMYGLEDGTKRASVQVIGRDANS